MTVGKQFEKNFAMICFLLSPSGGKRKTHFSLQNSERPFCLPTVTHSPPVSAIMALNIMYRQKKTDGNRPRLPSVSVAFLCILHNPLFMIRVVGLCNMLKLTIFQRKSQNIIDIYINMRSSTLQIQHYRDLHPEGYHYIWNKRLRYTKFSIRCHISSAKLYCSQQCQRR